jgi:NAD dependent epimerase/dehydratase family
MPHAVTAPTAIPILPSIVATWQHHHAHQGTTAQPWPHTVTTRVLHQMRQRAACTHDEAPTCAAMQEEMFCDEFVLVDLRVFESCKKVCEECDHVFNLAADMGGMGFIQSNHSVIMYNNTMISFNMIEAARQTGIKRCVARWIRIVRRCALAAQYMRKHSRVHTQVHLCAAPSLRSSAIRTVQPSRCSCTHTSQHIHIGTRPCAANARARASQVLLRVVRVHLPRGQAAERRRRGRRAQRGGRVARAAAGRVRPREARVRGDMPVRADNPVGVYE